MTNNQAVAYMLCAAKELKLEKELIIRLKGEMYWAFDMLTETEAVELAGDFSRYVYEGEKES